MIRTRLSIVFALLALLVIAQGLFTFWASRSATAHAQQSVLSTHLLNQYLELSANKQRLKVWFAQSALANDATLSQRDELLEKMAKNLAELETAAQRQAALNPSDVNNDIQTATALKTNFAALKQEIMLAEQGKQSVSDATSWRALIDVFDISEGADMRLLLEQAVARQRLASQSAERELNATLAQVQIANAVLTVLSVALGLLAVIYFVKRMHGPFHDLVQATSALIRGDYGQREVSTRSDEFGQFSRHLGRLAHQLKETQWENTKLMRGLDEAVAERTNAITRSHEALLKIESRRRQFFADLSHELRTPVTVIRGEAEIALRSDKLTLEDYRQSLHAIAGSAADLGSRVEDLLQAARTESLNYAINLQLVDLKHIISSAVEKLNAIAAHRQITLINLWGATDQTPLLARVLADKDRLQQALVILIDNAIRYSFAGAAVQIELREDTQAWQIIITDNGIGMTEAEQTHAFERHFRGEKAQQLSPTGAGLGLAIARDILSAHRGYITLSNNAPQGLQVSIHLPMLASDRVSTFAQENESSYESADR
jgi:two-component system, OmpR family, sensor kinase